MLASKGVAPLATAAVRVARRPPGHHGSAAADERGPSPAARERGRREKPLPADGAVTGWAEWKGKGKLHICPWFELGFF